MTKTELQEMIVEAFKAAGLKDMGIINVPTFYDESKIRTETEKGINFFSGKPYEWKRYYGTSISANIVNKHNAANDDISVDICVELCEGSCSRILHKFRVNTKQTEKTTMRKIDEAIRFYKSFVRVA